jgi:uncharacterized membrane protein YfcA
MVFSIEIMSAILGSLIGLMLALTGAGGTMLAIPLLVFFLPISIFQAAPIALIAVLMASSVGAIQGLRKGTVRYKTALLIASIGIALAPIGVKLAAHASDQLLSLVLVTALFFIGMQSWRQARQHETDHTLRPTPVCMLNPVTSRLFWTASCTRSLIGTGAITGFMSGLLGVGGGFIIVPSLHKVSNFSHQTVIATTLSIVSIIAISSVASHLHSNNIIWSAAIPFALSTTLTMLIISEKVSHQIPKHFAQRSFAILCLIAAASLVFKRLV